MIAAIAYVATRLLLVREMEGAAAYVLAFGASVPGDAVVPDSAAGVVGYLGDRAIHAVVHYQGLRYSFDRVVPEQYRLAVRSGELFVEPGLLYVCESG